MRYLILIIFICCNISLNAQKLSIDNSGFFYQISPLFDFKKGIVSLTFDDGYLNQFKIGMPLLKSLKMPATFYLITDVIDSTLKSIILDNLSPEFEIGSHTVSHPDLVKSGYSAAKNELFNSKVTLQEYFGMNAGLTLSYPWGIYNSSVKQIAKDYYLAARTTDPGYNSFYAPDRYALKVQGFMSQTKVSEANQWIDFSLRNHVWLVEMIHGINSEGFSPVDSSVLGEHFRYIRNQEDEVWCSSVVNVIKYINESENTVLTCELCNDTIYTVRVNNVLTDSVYDQPLSIKVKVPLNWDSISISGTGSFNNEYSDNNKFITFNVVPDNQVITIRPGLLTTPQKESGLRIIYMSANPFINNIRLSLDVLDAQDIDISLYDLNGRVIVHQVQKNANGVVNLVFDTDGMNSGIYFLKVTGSRKGSYILKKMIKI
jgi:beta-galactosidase